MTKQKSPVFKSTLVWSTAMALTLISIDNAFCDNTHFTDNVIKQESSIPTPVEAKAAEFQKVLQDFEGESNQKTTQASAEITAQPEVTPLEVVSLDTLPEESAPKITESTFTEDKPIVQSQVSVLPHLKTVSDDKQDSFIPPVIDESIKPDVISTSEHAPAENPEHNLVKNEPVVNVVELSSVQNGRSPLGILEANRDLKNQQWYLYSSAKRGIKNPNDVIEVVSVIGEKVPSHRGEEVKAILVEKGLKPENIKLIAVKGEEGQVGKIYIFGK